MLLSCRSIGRANCGYIIAINKLEGRDTLALAPDSQNRSLAAVFTCEEAFEAYYPECKQRYPEGELMQIPLAGPEMFAQLQATQLTGMVFNCAGRLRPIAFAAQFAEVVLNSGQSQPPA